MSRKWFHGEVASGNNSGAGTAFTLYLAGTTTAYTLGATEHLVITDMNVNPGASQTAKIVADADANGERVAFFNTSNLFQIREHGFVCADNTVPKLIASAATASEAVIEGFIE